MSQPTCFHLLYCSYPFSFLSCSCQQFFIFSFIIPLYLEHLRPQSHFKAFQIHISSPFSWPCQLANIFLNSIAVHFAVINSYTFTKLFLLIDTYFFSSFVQLLFQVMILPRHLYHFTSSTVFPSKRCLNKTFVTIITLVSYLFSFIPN